MRHINKGDAELIVHILQLDLHLLTHLQIQSAERLIQKKNLRLVHKCSCNRNSLLLTTGKRCNISFLKALQIHQRKDLFHLMLNDILRRFLLLQAERDVFIDIHMRKQRVALENRIDRSLIRRKIGDGLSVQKDLPRGRQLEARNHTESGCFSASGGPEKGDKFSAANLKVEVIHGCESVAERFGDVLQFDDVAVFHNSLLIIKTPAVC